MDLQKESIIDHLMERIIGFKDSIFTHYLKECLMRLPIKDLKAIIYEKDIHILQTHANTVLSIDPLLYDSGKGDKVLVVFVTNFWKCPAHQIMYIIAHEFAHVYLGHYDKSRWAWETGEIEANEQVKKWGFEEEWKRSRFEYNNTMSKSHVEP
jgi:hypothetical protein